MVKRLSPKDFEQLIDHILTRTGWARISTLGKTREGIDIEAENLAVGEIAFVQVKGSANQQVLNDYIERFRQRREIYARMIFAVHSPTGKLTVPTDHAVQVWTG
ncbi:MAG: restriction endonuclease [Desulfoferrobacter sp.]